MGALPPAMAQHYFQVPLYCDTSGQVEALDRLVKPGNDRLFEPVLGEGQLWIVDGG